MNKIERKLRWCAFVAYMSAPALVSATPWDYEDAPLWLESSVKHNLMFAIDDSGSMDWEVSFDVGGGTPRINSSGDFVTATGELSSSGVGNQYGYLFPNGYNRPYTGKRLYTGISAIPPIAAYASARASEYNRAYYDPSVTYNPWPTFSQYTDNIFENASLTATKYEPIDVMNSDTINLFTMFDTDGKPSYWGFNVNANNMVCRDTGATCGNGRKEYEYFPATYYLKDDSGKYYVHSGADGFYTSNSEIIEAESGAVSGFMQASSALLLASTGTENDKIEDARVSGSSSGNDFIGTLEATGASYGAAPSNGNATFTVDVPTTGLTSIWIRNLGEDSTTDSLWVNLSDGSGDYVGTLPNGDVWDGNNFGEMRYNMSDDGTWQWTKWSDVNLAAGAYTLELAYREGGLLIDQIIFTTSTGTPVGIEAYDSGAIDEKSCATSTVADYLDFTRNPEKYRASDSYVAEDSLIDNGRSLAFDGSCLTEYKITGADDDDPFVNGVGVTRTLEQEKQNFANWFQYHRKRHMAMRGALASSAQGMSGVKMGMFWLNRRRDIDAVDMNDMDTDAGIENFAREHFLGVPLYHQTGNAGTPLRSALDHARKLFVDTDGPIVNECQKNYTLLFTDGFNTQTTYNGGTTTDGDGNTVPIIGNEDGRSSAPFKDNFSGTLADIAYKAYSENLRPDITPAGKVGVSEDCAEPSPDGWMDCNTNLHMNTYTVGLGVRGNIMGVTHHDVKDSFDTPPTWPDVSSAGLDQIDDLYHAAVNGRGEVYSADSADELTKALDKALDDITDTIGSGSGVTFNSSSLQANDGTSLYTTLFNSTDWSGNISARALLGKDITDADGEVITPAGTVLGSVWKDSSGADAGAAELLDERDLSLEPRVIVTMGSTDGVPFQWDKLTDAQKVDLKTGPGVAGFPAGSDEAGQKRLDWVRGDMAIAGLRDRGSRLGDIVHSAPVYVGRPASIWPSSGEFGFEGTNANNFTDSKRYSDFKTAQKSRPATIYVGANDGMLHGFDARNNATDGGKEVFAYIPSEVYSSASGQGLHYLTDPNYTHKYYVDLSPVVQDVFMFTDSAKVSTNDDSQRDWVTMLLGGLRGGGKGLFALDVTDPTSFGGTDANAVAANSVLWEFNGLNAPEAANHLGYRVSTPAITKMNNGKWAAIFGNGYDSISGEAVLFIVFLEEGLDGSWTYSSNTNSDTDYMMIRTGVGSPSDKNGMSGVAVADTNGDYVADRIYAGDLKGNIWAFDMTDAPNGNKQPAWSVDYSGDSLFTAKDASGNPQPLTSAPSLVFNSEGDKATNDPNILVTFGTGSYLEKSDASDTSIQSYYTVWDQGAANLTRDSLTERTLTQTGNRLNLSGETDANGDVIVPWTMNGWFFDFAPEVSSGGSTSTTKAGERLINKPLLAIDKDVGPVAVFATTIPDSSECSGGGSSVLYGVPLLSGLDPEKPLIDLDGDGKVDSNDFGVGVTKDDLINDPNKLGDIIYGSKGDSEDVDATQTDIQGGGDREGRLGWFELVND